MSKCKVIKPVYYLAKVRIGGKRVENPVRLDKRVEIILHSSGLRVWEEGMRNGAWNSLKEHWIHRTKIHFTDDGKISVDGLNYLPDNQTLVAESWILEHAGWIEVEEEDYSDYEVGLC